MIFINMKRKTKSTITEFQLIKVEKKYNGSRPKYFYNIGFDNIEELLLLELDYPVKDSLVGMSVKYKLEDNVIVDFELV